MEQVKYKRREGKKFVFYVSKRGVLIHDSCNIQISNPLLFNMYIYYSLYYIFHIYSLCHIYILSLLPFVDRFLMSYNMLYIEWHDSRNGSNVGEEVIKPFVDWTLSQDLTFIIVWDWRTDYQNYSRGIVSWASLDPYGVLKLRRSCRREEVHFK